MNKIINLNNIVQEKYLNKGLIRSSKFKNKILDINSFQFGFKNFKAKKILKSKKYSSSTFFNTNIFEYFKNQKKDLKFVFLKKISKPTQIKYKNIYRNLRYSKSNCLITKPIRKGFRILSHKYKSFIKKKNLDIIIKRFKIQLLKNSANLTNKIYLSNLHESKNFIFHKLLFTCEIKENYNNFRFFTKKVYNKRKRIKKLKLNNKIILKHSK